MNILLLLIALIMTSCVSRTQYKRDLNTVADAAKTAIVLAVAKERAECSEAMTEKDARLKRFNQLNADGSLR